MFPRLKKYLLMLIMLVFPFGKLLAQSNYEIRFEVSELNEGQNKLCLEVQLSNRDAVAWNLAGQNYRLFYNTAKMKFNQGNSLLGNQYQAFTLVQKVEEIDASKVNGDLSFATNLGFLNYAIDLNDVVNGGITLPADSTWITTSQLCFDLITTENSSTDEAVEVVWARAGHTNAYANSFVEIQEWVTTNRTQAAIGTNYYDFLLRPEETSTQLAIKVWLQGAYEEATGLMRDDLRIKNLLPLTAPYTSLRNFPNAIVHFLEKQDVSLDRQVFEKEGVNAIVDWMAIALHNEKNPAEIAWATVGLIQRDGDIVALDGLSPLTIPRGNDSLYVSIRHRNHLGVMTQKPIWLGNKSINVIDFTDLSTPTFGSNATVKSEKYQFLRGGNTDSNGYLVLQGGGIALPDTDHIFFDVFEDEKNVNGLYNHISYGYYSSDTNMDGEVRYQGGGNEIDEMIFFNIYRHPQNTGALSNFFIKEQIPN